MAPVRHLPPLTLTSRRMHARREQLLAIKGRGGKATLGTRKGIAERPTTRASVHHEGTDTLPVNYHGEVRPRPTSRTATACAVARRAERTAARPLPGPESPASLAQKGRESLTLSLELSRTRAILQVAQIHVPFTVYSPVFRALSTEHLVPKYFRYRVLIHR